MANRKHDTGRLWCIVCTQHTLLLLSSLGITAAVYQLLDSELFIFKAASILTLIAPSLTALFILLHNFAVWQRLRAGPYAHYQGSRIFLRCRDVTSLAAALTWAGASTLNLIVASTSPSCQAGEIASIYWRSQTLVNCKIQKAETAVCLLAMIFCAICCVVAWTTKSSLCASLAGLHHDSFDDEEFNLTTKLTHKRTRSRKFSCDTSVDAMSINQPPARGITWLPKMDFEIPTKREQMVMGYNSPRPTLVRTETERSALLPTLPPTEASASPRQSVHIKKYPKHARSQTLATVSSSVYSSNGAGSLFSYVDSMSSMSEHDWSACNRDKSKTPRDPDAPLIPPRRRPPMTDSLRNGGKPMRPRSRPPMPPPSFWQYAKEEQARQEGTSEGHISHHGQQSPQRRYTESSQPFHRSATQPCLGTCVTEKRSAGPATETLTHEQNAQRTSYDQIRKGVSMPFCSPRKVTAADLSDVFDEVAATCNPEEGIRGRQMDHSEGRTLVKMRQPWDKGPRPCLK